jgi:hypothetical protein
MVKEMKKGKGRGNGIPENPTNVEERVKNGCIPH